MNQTGHQENGMVIDFGNIKKYMMDIIDSVFDHGFVVYSGDKAMMDMFFADPGLGHQNDTSIERIASRFNGEWQNQLKTYIQCVHHHITPKSIELRRTCHSDQDPDGMKVIIVDYVPTAENLAKHFFEMLAPVISAHYGDDTIRLVNIRLYETPNGFVDYGTMSVL